MPVPMSRTILLPRLSSQYHCQYTLWLAFWPHSVSVSCASAPARSAHGST